MENALTFAKNLKAMAPTMVLTNPTVCDQFVTIYNSVWGGGGEGACNRESLYFVEQIKSSDALRKCTGPSIYYAFIDLAVKGLSLQPGPQAQCYLLPRNIRTGVTADGKPVFETTCSLTISGYGELVLRKRAGQILYADNPVVVYEGDTFEFGERDGRKFVNYAAKFPRGTKIIACFVKITRTDGTADYSVMLENDWKRLAGYSAKNNAKWDNETRQKVAGSANDLYTSNGGQIDTGFLVAKTVKHAFKTYPKIAVGRGSAFAADLPDEQTGVDPYGGVAEALEGGSNNPEETRSSVPDDFTAAPAQGETGVRVEAQEDDTF